MWIYVIRRLLYTMPILFGVVLITFVVFFTFTSPENLARQSLGPKADNPDQVADWLKDKGYAELNASGVEKIQALERDPTADVKITAKDVDVFGYPRLFVNYVRDLLTLDFGQTRDERQVTDVLRAGMGPSLALTVPAFLLSEILGVFFALFAALYRNTRTDRVLLIFSVLLMSVSPVALILFLQKFLAAEWSYFPVAGYDTGPAMFAYLALPIFIYVVVRLGENIRFNRILVLDEIGQDYVRTARAKGVHQNTVLFKHVLRNALIPMITHWSVAIPFLFLGSLLLESFFGIPGLGGITIDSVKNTDVNVVRALVFIGTLLYIFATLVSDVLYAIVDPRVKLG